MVFVLSADGKVDIQVKDEAEDAIERIIAAVLKLPITATVDTVKAAVEAAKPKEGSGGTQPAPAG